MLLQLAPKRLLIITPSAAMGRKDLRKMHEWRGRRSPVFATNGIVASSQPLASEIGLSILKKGGNAADAAVGVAAALNVTQPTSTGIGGDVFCLFYDNKTKTVRAINGSGRCASKLSIDVFHERGFNESNRPPSTSSLWITAPGAAAGWVDTVERFGTGKLSLTEILSPAIALAENGYPVNVCTAHAWNLSEDLLLTASSNGRELLVNGKSPKAGEIMKMPRLANTFRLLGSNGKKGFYEGPVAEAILQVVKETGGVLSGEDLVIHRSTFEDPIHVNYRGVDIFECPPNGQGITALVALNILEGFDVPSLKPHSAEHLHLMIESLRLAFADTRYYVTDPEFSKVPTEGLLSKIYATERRSFISQNRAATNLKHGYPENSSSTVYFCVVDGEGNACSFINSNYEGFGTHIIPQGCGFTLQNRGHNFSLDKNHPNCLEPKKRPYHTIIPGMALKDGELWCAFGVMGGFMQPQGHVQVISNMLDFNMDPQEALDAPRFLIDDGDANGGILLEEGIREEVREQLLRRGHIFESVNFVSGWNRNVFGCGQIIKRNPVNGVLCAGSDPRHDGMAIGW